MKATMEFMLPEEQQEHLQALLGHRAWAALYDIKNTIRRHKKDNGSADVTLNTIQEIIYITMEGME